MVSATHASYRDQKVDLPEFILQNRDRLVYARTMLRPNSIRSEGRKTDEAGWSAR